MYAEEIHFGKLLLKQSLTPVTLTFDPVTPTYIGSSASQDKCVRMLGQGVLELLIGNEKVTDGRTYRLTDVPTDPTTCAKQYALSSLKGGIINCILSILSISFL